MSRNVAATVRQRCSWTIHRRSGWKGLLARAGEVLAAIVYLRTGGWVLAPTDATVPMDPRTPLDVMPAVVRGHAAFLSPYASEAGTAMTLCCDRATIDLPLGVAMVETVVPLEILELVSARPTSRQWFPKGPTSDWLLELHGRHGERITISAPWLTLAWVAHLAGWPEPDVPG